MEDLQNKQLVPPNFDFGPAEKYEKKEQDEFAATEEYVEMPKTTLAEDMLLIEDETTKAQTMEKIGLSDRMMADELINSKKTFGDSKEMKAVKEDLIVIENMLKEEKILDGKKMPLTQSDFSKIQEAYINAIRHCDDYLGHTHPSSKVGKQRMELVIKNRDRLLREAALMAEASELVLSGRLSSEMSSLGDVLYSARIYALSPEPAEKMGPEREKTSTTNNKVLAESIKFFKVNTKEIKDKKAARKYAYEVKALRRELKEFPEGKIHSTFVQLNGEYIRISQDEHGVITLGYGDTSVVMKEDIADLINYLDTKMVEEQARMDPEAMAEMLFDQTVDYVFYTDKMKLGHPDIWGVGYKIKDVGDIQKTGTRLARYLELKTGHPATYFSNLNDNTLRWISVELAKGMDVKEAMKALDECIKKAGTEERLVNTNETLELINTFSQMKKVSNAESLVEYHKAKKDANLLEFRDEKKEKYDEKGWRQDESAVKDLLADFVFSEETWVTDEKEKDPGERIRLMLLKHTDTLAMIIADNFREDQNSPSLVDRILDKLPLEMGEDGESGIKEQIRAAISDINVLINHNIDFAFELRDGKYKGFDKALIPKEYQGLSTEQYKNKLNEIKCNVPFMSIVIKSILDGKDKDLMKKLYEVDDMIETAVISSAFDIQKTINQKTETVFGADQGDQEDPTANLLDPKQKGIRKAERQRRVKAGDEALKKILQNAMKGDSGQGRFIKIVFGRYFGDADIMDQRNMFASAIKNMGPKRTLPDIPDDADEDQIKMIQAIRDRIMEEEAGAYLGGLLKGAGPLFQKMLQGLPVAGMPASIAMALEDMKSKLAPIPDEIVKAQLLGMVQRSKGKISKIKVEKALGAASVGQTFLCKMYGPDLPKEGKDVVVKLLKPDVRNRMMREKKLMLECARATDTTGGMEATYKGQLSRIEEELDLTIEARNVMEGNEVYDSQKDEKYDAVKSMKLNDLVTPTINSMVLEKAPGETVDRYLSEVKDEIARLLEEMEPKEEEKVKTLSADATDEEIKRVNDIRAKYSERLYRIHEELMKKLEQLTLRQQYMTTLADKWVTEGIFGQGFYHGDLHAGNIMIDDNGATLIDFGNATKLSSKQQVEVTRMVGAAAVGDAEGFRDGLHALIKPEFEGIYNEKKKELTIELKKIFSIGDKNSAGQRVGVALIKAQEMGLEVPSAIFNFSQCQLRLQNTIDSMNTTIDSIGKGLNKVNTLMQYAITNEADLYEKSQFTRLGFTYINFVQIPGQEQEDKPFDRYENSYEQIKKLRDLYIPASEEEVELFLADSVRSTSFMTELGKLEEGMNKIRQLVDNKAEELFKKKGEKGEAAVKGEDLLPSVEVGAFYEALVRPLSVIERICPVANYKEELKDYLKEISEKIADGTFKNLNELKSSEDYDRHLNRRDETINEAKDIVVKYQAIRAKGGKETQEEHKALVTAVTQFNEKVLLYDKLAGFNGFMTDMSKFGTSQKEKDVMYRFDIEIKRLSESDDEYGQDIRTLYDKIREDQAQNIDKLTIKQEIFQLFWLLSKVAGKKLDEAYKTMAHIHSMGEPKTFVDVMGKTIMANLSTSFSRLGPITSMKYKSKLEDNPDDNDQ